MSRLAIHILSFAFVISIFGCTKTIEFDGETKEPKIVINSLFNTRDTFRVHVSRSLALVDAGDLKPLKNAVLKVYDSKNNLVATPIHTKNGMFEAADFKPEDDEAYTIECEQDGYKSVSATDIIPADATIDRVDTSTVPMVGGGQQIQVDCVIDDQPGENFYMVRVKVGFTHKIDSNKTLTSYDYIWINTLDPNVDGGSAIDPYYAEQLVFSDANFDEKQYTFRFNIDSWFLQDEFISSMDVELLSLSEATYNYFISLGQYDRTNGNPFATPVQVYSNVDGGFGIFGGAAAKAYPIR
mgnify:CR=1 FL=1